MELTGNDRKLLEGMRAAVAERGADYTYPEEHRFKAEDEHSTGFCRYVWEGEPDCLIGDAVVRAGLLTVGELINFEGEGASTLLRGHVSTDVARAADYAQSKQDTVSYEDGRCGTWGEALTAFENELTVVGHKL